MALTSANFTAVPQMFVGCSHLRPIVINNDVLFIESKGSHVRDLQFEWSYQSYTGNDLSVMAEHLFYGYTLTDWAFAQFPFNLLWACRSDGSLLGMTYLKEQNVWAWHQHSTVNGAFLSVAVVPERNAHGVIEDVPYFLVKREIGVVSRAYIERLASRQLGTHNNDCAAGWFVDSGLSLTGENVALVHGLEHLAGQSVSACIDGKGYTGLNVDQNGRCVLPVLGHRIIIGLQIAAHLKTLPMALTHTPLFGRRKRVSRIFASLSNSAGLSVASCANHSPVPIDAGPLAQKLTNEMRIALPTPEWSHHGQMVFQQSYPLPFTLNTLSLETEIGR